MVKSPGIESGDLGSHLCSFTYYQLDLEQNISSL